MKTVTYTEIDYAELEQLIETYLGIETQSVHNFQNFKHGCFSVVQDLEANNDTRVCLGTKEDMVDYGLIDEGPLTYQYVYQLMELGHIPTEYPILLDISW